MSDADFKKWHTMLWEAIWTDKDPRFNGKTIEEMWNILIQEEHFPKDEFYDELDIRGLLPDNDNALEPFEVKGPNDDVNLKNLSEFCKRHRWKVATMHNHNVINLRSKSTMSTFDVCVGDVIQFYRVGSNWFIRHNKKAE